VKKLLTLFSLVIIGFIWFTGQKTDESPRWYFNPQMTSVQKTGGEIPVATNIGKVTNPNTETRIVNTSVGTMAINPNVIVYPSLNQQCEIYMTRDHNNPQILYVASQNIRGSSINAGTYVSTNGGTTWVGSDTMAAPSMADQRGDPGPTIDKNGRFIYTHLTSTTNFGGLKGMGANYSTNKGQTWSATFDVVIDANCDKNLANTDDVPGSPYYGNSYMAWTSFGTTPGNGRMSRTTDGGVTWSPQLIINATPSGHNAQGHDVVVGVNGEVYIFWSAGVSSSPFTEDFIGMAKSTNGGVNFVATENAFDVNGSRSASFNGWGIRTNGFPRTDIDKSSGPRRGTIYVVTPQINLAPAGTDSDIILRKSSDGGATWSPGIRVNQDPLNNAKVQFFPCVKVDEAGGVNVVYYDNRDFPSVNDSCTVYLSRSLDGGATWADTKLADHNFKPKNLPGVNTMGDYIGITAGNGKVYAAWMDDKTGSASTLFQTWVGSVTIQLNALNPFNIQTPTANARIVTFPGSTTPVTITWDTSTITANYKFKFGNVSKNFTIPSGTNSITTTLGALDDILASSGFTNNGTASDSAVGQWDVWAFKAQGAPGADSLKSTNGPRGITFRRGVPALTPFSLVTPPNGTRIVTSVFNSGAININWTRSGSGTRYKWMFDAPTFAGAPIFSIQSGNTGFDSSITLINNQVDGMLAGLGLAPGDSVVGQWRVYAYRSASDSLASTQTFALTFKRQAKGDILVAYDSTAANCRTSRDSVITNLSTLGLTFDLFNRGTNTSTNMISLRGYKKVIWLGEGTSTISPVQRDSVKSYLNAGGTSVGTKSKLIIFSEDVGYNLDRTGSTNLDTTLARQYLGLMFVADRPATGAGLVGLRGINILQGQRDSCSGPWPDVMRRSNTNSNKILTGFRLQSDFDSLNSIGRQATNYNTATFGLDVESMKNANGGPTTSPVARYLKAALDYVDQLLVNTGTEGTMIPEVFSLSQNYPNPFNPTTKINFAVPKSAFVSLKIFDVTGREVANLVNNTMAPGYHSVDFNASAFASGVYFYRIEAADFVDTKRMMLIK
jgi:hypothetical protein